MISITTNPHTGLPSKTVLFKYDRTESESLLRAAGLTDAQVAIAYGSVMAATFDPSGVEIWCGQSTQAFVASVASATLDTHNSDGRENADWVRRRVTVG